jgi:hypothetical protein
MADQNIALDFDLSRERRKKLATHHSNALYPATIRRFGTRTEAVTAKTP